MQTRKLELFTTIHTEGAVLPVDLLQRILDGDSNIDGITSESFHLGAGEKITEAVNRSWNIIKGKWEQFKDAGAKLSGSETGTSLTRERWLLPLFQELGYGRLLTAKAAEIDGRSYNISHGWQHSPIHLVSFKLDLDKKTAGATGASKSSPHSLVQEFLNASGDHLWGFVSNGLKLRILRDNKSITRQAFVEFDLESMMEGEVYSDFILLWMLCHQSRVEADKPEECWLEKWTQTAQEQGTRALDQLRNGVEQALTELGHGFTGHPSNTLLREHLKSGTLAAQEYYRQLFRLVYRLLFLFVAEDRNLLLDPEADNDAKERYNRYYSVTRLRIIASKIRGGKHCDAWEGVRVVMDILSGDQGYKDLGLPPLGGYLFSDEAIPDLHDCEISNHDFLTAIRSLAFIIDKGTLRPVDYRNLRSEEFGSVYESLLELHPVVNVDAGTFELKFAGGNERKTTASYYTHDSLVQCLLDSALDPVLDDAVKKEDPEKAILALKVCDFASGSGHFLTAAAHRMAKRLAAIRTEEEEPAPEAMRTALRDVIGHCIYGVDINPMAVELCKVALWMEALEAGKPLSFLDHHIRCGNSLIGATPALLKEGIPDAAFTPIEGDDKSVCAEYKKLNKEEREKRQITMFDREQAPWEQLGNLTTAMMAVDEMSDDTIVGVKAKQKKYEELTTSTSSLFGKFLADVWCASFVWKKTKEFSYPITEEVFRNIERNPHSAPVWMKNEVERLSREYQFFHWHLAFPDLFYVSNQPENEQTGWSGGFDVILGNPPWEKIHLRDEEFFAVKSPEISTAKNKAIRKKLIARLIHDDHSLHNEYQNEKRKHDALSMYLRNCGQYPLTGISRINLYSIFAEQSLCLIALDGRFGLILSSGIATDKNNKDYFATLIESNKLISFWDFVNNKKLFADVHALYKFCILVAAGGGSHEIPDFVFNLTATNDLSTHERHFTLSGEDLITLNPISRTCPVFNNTYDASLAKHIYRNISPLAKHDDNVLNLRTPFNMANDAKYFIETADLKLVGGEPLHLPLYEAKYIHQHNHRYAEIVDHASGEVQSLSMDALKNPGRSITTRYLLPVSIFEERFDKSWYLVFRDISGSANERTAISTIIPRYPCGDTLNVIECDDSAYTLIISGVINSFIYDYLTRQKVSGTHLNHWIFRQLPLPSRSEISKPLVSCNSQSTSSYQKVVETRIIELQYSSLDMYEFFSRCGHEIGPYVWDEERRFLLRCEIDAATFLLYEIEHDDVDYIMETFPIVKRKDEAKHGEYRTKRVILEMYDQMKAAMETGTEYQTWLDPPPADPRVAHKVE